MVCLLLQLHSRSRLAADASIHDARLAVARFGGHIKNNGSPGWIGLGRGYEEGLMLAEGPHLGLQNDRKDRIYL
jgi:hypothetical protein